MKHSERWFSQVQNGSFMLMFDDDADCQEMHVKSFHVKSYRSKISTDWDTKMMHAEQNLN